jgi:hypothetical protein
MVFLGHLSGTSHSASIEILIAMIGHEGDSSYAAVDLEEEVMNGVGAAAPATNQSPDSATNAKDDEGAGQATAALEGQSTHQPDQSTSINSKDLDLDSNENQSPSTDGFEMDTAAAADAASASVDISADGSSDASMSDGYDPPDAESPDPERNSSNSFSPEVVTDVGLGQAEVDTKQQISAGHDIASPDLETVDDFP